MNVTFKFNLGDFVTNKLGGGGFIECLLFDRGGNQCLVKTADGNTSRWPEQDLTLKTEATK